MRSHEAQFGSGFEDIASYGCMTFRAKALLRHLSSGL
jgi:hypothetical protein